MLFLTRFTTLLVNMASFIEIRRISPEHIRVWLRILDPAIKIEATPDPRDPEELVALQSSIDALFIDFLDLVQCRILEFNETREVRKDVMEAMFNLNVAIDLAVRASAERQKQGDEGWVYINLHFMRAIAEGLITPDTLEIFLRSITPRTTYISTIDA